MQCNAQNISHHNSFQSTLPAYSAVYSVILHNLPFRDRTDRPSRISLSSPSHSYRLCQKPDFRPRDAAPRAFPFSSFGRTFHLTQTQQRSVHLASHCPTIFCVCRIMSSCPPMVSRVLAQPTVHAIFLHRMTWHACHRLFPRPTPHTPLLYFILYKALTHVNTAHFTTSKFLIVFLDEAKIGIHSFRYVVAKGGRKLEVG